MNVVRQRKKTPKNQKHKQHAHQQFCSAQLVFERNYLTRSFRKRDILERQLHRMLQTRQRTVDKDVGIVLQTAPVLWTADAGSSISALHVDNGHILLATNDAKGDVYILYA